MSKRAILSRAGRPAVGLTLLAFGLAAMLAVMAVGIDLTHEQTKNRLLTNFKLRGTTSAGFVSTYLTQQVTRERLSARRLLAGRKDLTTEFDRTTAAFGSEVAGLFDRTGHVLAILPHDPALIGKEVASKYTHLTAAEAGHWAVSSVVLSAARHQPVVAIAVPFQTLYGRRVFSPAYPVAGSVLATFVEHTIAYKKHLVVLIDGKDNIIAASPRSGARTLQATSPALAKDVIHKPLGSVTVDGKPGTFLVTPVAGTPWRIVIAVPNAKLFASISGWALWLPWIVFAMIACLALAVLLLFSRSLASRSRLESLSVELARAARTDTVTGLANRRSLEERLTQASAYANRYQEPLSALLIDLDEFKDVNDTWGHDAGDEVLRAVAECMRRVFRESDIYGRWGGDEFLAILPGRDQDAERAAERLRAEVKALDTSRFGVSKQLTLSVGVASATNVSPLDLIIQADDALYRAKREGRDQVAVTARGASPVSGPVSGRD
jgi:diguanylate cyclase (GGDEF)-like protein